MKEVVIVSAVRTAIGNFQGGLSGFSATELGALAIEEAIKRAGVQKEQVDEVIMGNVVPIGLGQNPARQAMIKAGLPMEGGAITVNKVCGSGLKTVMLADQAIKCGDADIIAAGGMESMSNIPHYLQGARDGFRLGNTELVDGMVHDGLWDVVNDYHMGYTADLVAEKFSVTRQEMDEFSVLSNDKAIAAHEGGNFKAEIMPITIQPRKGDAFTFDRDEGPRKATLEKLATLKSAFSKSGRVTAGNASKISDGASCVVVMSREKADQLGLKPLARIIAQGAAGIELPDVLVAPIKSIPKVLKKAGLNLNDIGLHEINEAFAASTIAIIKELAIDPARVNIHGGAVAVGHPIGCSGARVLTTLLYALKEKNEKYGMASLCLGGAESVSMIIENLT
ncbi:MAG: acetyl-CoA C-acetyltransferase [Deltaproteobacteria bacterium]|nr:acetyl-CoA C-acetyltransferase [Deltaproteobacteria bacterium]MBT7893134.1 acetyl-CoA C-acetyltransferase [Deltaproteobacteria bacterium]